MYDATIGDATTSASHNSVRRPLLRVPGSVIARFAHAYAPLDESLSRVVLDLGKRPFLFYGLDVRGRIGDLESETLEEWWRAFSIHAGATIHVDLMRGGNRHHMVESAFKALGLALGEAVRLTGGEVPSTKGMLG